MAKSEGSTAPSMGLTEALEVLHDLHRPRSIREAALRVVRSYERRTGIPLEGEINGRPARRQA
jgi:hypothetical protein